MVSRTDPYEALGVRRGATPDQIRSAFRKLARKLHPDVNPGDRAAEERFKLVNHAHEVLSDPEKRRLYDEFGDEGLRPEFDAARARAYRQWRSGRPAGAGGRATSREFADAGGVDGDPLEGLGGLGGGLGRLFEELTGRAGRAGRRGGRRSPEASGRQDVLCAVELDLISAIRGIEVTVQVPSRTAASPGTPLLVRIPPGADDGSKLRVAGRGAPAFGGGPPGDLIIETHVRPHPFFRRHGLDLVLRLPVTVGEAYGGASVEVPTPDGPVILRIPPRSQVGTRLRLRGKGVARGARKGDLYAELDVRMPDRDDARLAEALEQTAAAAYSQPVRRGLKL
jgi:curved DNA-binding protein